MNGVDITPAGSPSDSSPGPRSRRLLTQTLPVLRRETAAHDG